MKKEFVSYNLALELKELGFDEPCLASYETAFGKNGPDFQIGYIIDGPKNYVLVPTFSQAFRWFDENTQLKGFVVPSIKEEHFDWLIRIDWEEEIECEEAYTSRIQAELACLEKLIEIVKTK